MEDVDILCGFIWTGSEETCRIEKMHKDDSVLALAVVLSAMLSAAPALIAMACNCLS